MNLESYELKARKKLKHIADEKINVLIAELLAKVDKARESNPDKSLKLILKQLGPIEFVLNDILIAHGLRPLNPPKKFYGYLLVGIISFALIFSLIIFLFIKKITPIVKIDDDSNRISILGGLIDVNGKAGSINFNNQFNMELKTDHQFSGELKIDAKNKLLLTFKNAKLNLTSSQNDQLTWKCFLSAPLNQNLVTQINNEINLNLEAYEGIHCDFKIPKTIELISIGKNAHINLLSPHFSSDFEIENFNLQFSPQINKLYKIEIDAKGALIDNFENFYAEDGIKLKIKGNNGRFQLL